MGMKISIALEHLKHGLIDQEYSLTSNDKFAIYETLVDVVYKWQLMQADYENRLKAEREKIAEDVAEKMDYMGSCLNEKNIILGVITGKRETLDSLCSTCKSESCVSNGTAISKADYNERLKADLVAILTDLQLDVEGQKFDVHIDKDVWNDAIRVCANLIQQKINVLKTERGQTDDK